jgi:hypothetical protein
MPRGFKIDRTGTFCLHFRDKRSFLSQTKIIPDECIYPRSHLILYGKDKISIRAEIFKRNRQANGGVNRCEKCKCLIYEKQPLETFGSIKGDWHHIRNEPGTRCDCPENGECLCYLCHHAMHPHVQFGKSKIVSQTT